MPEALVAARFATFFAVLAWASITDLRTRLIPNALNLWGLLAVLALRLAEGLASAVPPAADWWGPERDGLLGAVALGLAMLALHFLSRGTLGMGDVKLSLVIGAALGPAGGGVAILIGFVAGAVLSLFLLAAGRVRLRDSLPFGPVLALGAVISALWGPSIAGWLGGGLFR